MMKTRQTHLRPSFRFLVVLCSCALLLVGCGSDSEVATDMDTLPEVTPGTNNELPSNIEAASLTIVDGSFDVDELVLHRGEPVQLTVVNRDDVAYTFEIPDLVNGTTIAATTTTDIGFTTPTSGMLQGRLIAADGSVRDEIHVRVLSPGGV